MNYNWNWLVFFDLEPGATGTYLSYLFGGLGWTVIAALASWILALSLGTLVGVLRTLGNPVLEKVCFVYVELFRNVPLLVQMFLWYFVRFVVFIMFHSLLVRYFLASSSS